jgi:hypothetical protein
MEKSESSYQEAGDNAQMTLASASQPPNNEEKIRLERIALDPIPNVGLLGLDKGKWHCGGGMGGL